MGRSTLPPTKAGVPPLFLACENKASLDIIWRLVQHSPELFQAKKSNENCALSRPKKRRDLN
jgi:hypothetical protein